MRCSGSKEGEGEGVCTDISGSKSMQGRKREGERKRTDINGHAANGWQEHLDIGTGDEFGVHSSSVLEERTAEESLRSGKTTKNKRSQYDVQIPKHHHEMIGK